MILLYNNIFKLNFHVKIKLNFKKVFINFKIFYFNDF